MSSSDQRGGLPSREELADRAEQQEPLFDTPLLDTWAEMDMPLRGERRQNVIDRLRAQIKGRRTVEGISARLADNLASPITTAIEQETEGVVRQRVEEFIQNRARNGPEVKNDKL